MKKSTARRSLLMSAISLLLCVSMLVGTTFAWFTDSVASANNIIKSGNLDIKLEYAVFNDDGTFNKWEDVAGMSDILTNTLWEPGVTEVAYLKVTNAGSLALKYQLGINIVHEDGGVNQAGDNFRLSDFIYFDVVEGVNGETNPYGSRADAMKVATETRKISRGYSEYRTMEGKKDGVEAVRYLAIVAHMPEHVGNEANHNGVKVPEIKLGINVYAAQVEAELDSFGSDYDKNAAYDQFLSDKKFPDGNYEDLSLMSNGDTTNYATIPAALVNDLAEEGANALTFVTKGYSVSEETAETVTVTYEDILLKDQLGRKVDLSGNTDPIAVKLLVGNKFAGKYATIYHDGELIASGVVDAEGYVAYNALHFCAVAVTISNDAPAHVILPKDEDVEDTTKVQMLVGSQYYTVSNGFYTSWQNNGGQVTANVHIPEDLLAYSMMYKNGDLPATGGTHSTLSIQANLDFSGMNWEPIGRFFTDIEGNNKTVSSLNDSLLGCVYDCQVKNLTVMNVTASGSASGVIAKELAGDIYLNNVVIAGDNSVTYQNDSKSNWPEQGTGVGAICGVSLIGGNGSNIDVTVTGSIEVNYNGVIFGNNTNLQNLGVSKEFGLNVYEKNAAASVKLEGGSITTKGDYAIELTGPATLTGGTYVLNGKNIASADANAIVVAENSTILVKADTTVSGGKNFSGILVNEGKTLTVIGSNSAVLTVSGNDKQEYEPNGNYSNTTDASYEYMGGSGIKAANATLVIQDLGGLVAEGYGIGGFGIGGSGANVTIKNTKNIVARGGFQNVTGEYNDAKYNKSEPEGGAAIGGSTITITGSEITRALGGSKAAGIGARFHEGTIINISNTTIANVVGGASSAGIGGSRVSNGASEPGVTINISGSSITAQGGYFGAGIGSGYDTHCQAEQPLCTINIDGSTINATGGKYAAGIGTGFHHSALAGEIKNSTINATSGEKVYKDTYSSAMDVGFGVTDPTREGTQKDSYIDYNGERIVNDFSVSMKVTSAEELLSALSAVAAGTEIDATDVTVDINSIGTDAPGGIKAYYIPGGVTIKGLSVVGSYRGGNYFIFAGSPDQEIIFEDCTFETQSRAMGLGLVGDEGGSTSVVYNDCTFKGPIITNFVANTDGAATFNNCTFTKAASGNNYVMAMGGTHTFKGCTFDYTGVTQTNIGTVNTATVNACSDSDNSYSTTVILDGCTRINCGTRTYGPKSTLTIK